MSERVAMPAPSTPIWKSPWGRTSETGAYSRPELPLHTLLWAILRELSTVIRNCLLTEASAPGLEARRERV